MYVTVLLVCKQYSKYTICYYLSIILNVVVIIIIIIYVYVYRNLIMNTSMILTQLHVGVAKSLSYKHLHILYM